MVDYIRQSLSSDEELIHVAQFHWMYVISALLNLLFSFVLSIIILYMALKFEPVMFGPVSRDGNLLAQVMSLHPGVKILAFFIFLMGLLKFAQMMIIKATTEIGVTDTRLVYKRGLVARAVGEINIDRVEGVNVLQGVIGRIFGYGRVMVRGMGVGEVILPPIAQPIRFKKAIEHARNKSRKKRNTMVMPTDESKNLDI
jgi:uncharacterized membrane protein YdbT with pleckstrin-like domain